MGVLAMPRVAAAGPVVLPARRGDARYAVDALTLAFGDDPPCRWMYPDEEQYLRYFPRFVEVFGGAAIADGTALVTGGISGAALWLSPDTALDEEALFALVEESVAGGERSDAFALFEAMGRHHPDEPHWYLPLIGVDPALHGNGYGAALLRHGLRWADEAALPAYLEATTARSVPLYERHGFEVIGEIRVGACPPIFPMLRSRRACRLT